MSNPWHRVSECAVKPFAQQICRRLGNVFELVDGLDPPKTSKGVQKLVKKTNKGTVQRNGGHT
jgi:hypothetical protein